MKWKSVWHELAVQYSGHDVFVDYNIGCPSLSIFPRNFSLVIIF